MKIINLFGGPNSGKSTVMAGLFYLMKIEGFEVEINPEVAKRLHHEKRFEKLKDQLSVLGGQHDLIFDLKEQVDFIITDSPLLLSAIYAPEDYLPSFTQFVKDLYLSYDNINIFLNRPKGFNQNLRSHSLEESIEKDEQIKKMLSDLDVRYDVFQAKPDTHLEIYHFLKQKGIL